MTPDKDSKAPREWLFWAVVLVIGLLGIWLIAGWRLAVVEEHFRLALGHALLIAAILAAIVDPFVKKRLVWEIASNVWQYVAGHHVPTELSAYLHDSLQARIIRRNFYVHYQVSRRDCGLKARVQIEYDVENYGNGDESYPLFISEEEHKAPDFQEISCVSNDPDAVVDPKKIKLKITGKGTGVVRAEARTITVHPVRTDASYKVRFVYDLNSLTERGSDVISFNGPTINVTIRADMPTGVVFIPPELKTEQGSIWTYRRVFLKEQHLHVRWFPEGDPAAEAAKMSVSQASATGSSSAEQIASGAPGPA